MRPSLKILLSGASSFTGYWFAHKLRQSGHHVTCLYRGESSRSYSGLRSLRVEKSVTEGEAIFSCSFGSEKFLEVAAGRWDVYAHHAADVANYKSPDFDVIRAVENNTYNLRKGLATLKRGGCQKVVLTGSVFEQGEGAGSDELPAILPYGLSKGLTSQVFQFEAALAKIRLGKFVIPNPFGPLQEPRFVQYLVKTWRQGETAKVETPDYVRDNIPVDLLALEYQSFLEHLPSSPGYSRCAPSGIVSDQGTFAQTVARELRERLGWPCDLEVLQQTEFHEPLIRINTDRAGVGHPNQALSRVWDQLAAEATEGDSKVPQKRQT